MLTIDLDSVADNFRRLAERVAPAECAAVVKADAYGLGLAPVARTLAAAGARTFFVAQLTEGLALRAILPEARIGVLNGLMPDCEADYAGHRLLPVLNHLGEIARWAAWSRREGAPLPAFVHIDTGMNRLGLGRDDLAVLAAEPERLAGIRVCAWISHLACADQAGHPMTPAQLQAFRAALARLPPAPASLANSAGIFCGRDYHFDLARPGCALYGGNPTPAAANPMRQTIRLQGRVLQLRVVDSAMTVGYGAAYTARDKAKIATVAVGYADGYLRSLSNGGSAWVAGRIVPVVGRVSMDLITIDVTTLPEETVSPGALVELIGPHVPVDEVARAAGTISYEILTALGSRYARIWAGGAAGDSR